VLGPRSEHVIIYCARLSSAGILNNGARTGKSAGAGRQPHLPKAEGRKRKGSIASMSGQLFYVVGDVAVKARHVAEER
jgi:hypothetical protein